MTLLFWFSLAVVAYVYVGYPLILRLWARLAPTPYARADAGSSLPGVSIVIAAHDEAARLPARIENLLSLDYPAVRRQIIVVSDGSTDGTCDVLRKYAPLVDVVRIPRGGKAAALNAARVHARFDIVVFADARQVFASDALRELVAPFDDPAVGGVTGELLLDCEPSTIGDGVGVYWRYEKGLRRLESAVGSTLGATGAIYAIRRALWEPLPPDTILDDVLTPMRVVMAGYRVVFNEKARAFDRASADADAESRRKVRTLAGNYQILWLEPRLLLPWRNPVWLQYLSHKVGRLAVPYALLAIFGANIVIAATHVMYQASLVAQVGFYLLAGYGAVLETTSRQHAAETTDRVGAASAATAVKGAA
jgi:poly-beta-1,6-N-acetyl-D-glucosamine synthase